MQIVSVVSGVPFADVKHGTIVQFFVSGKPYVGMKIHGEQCDGVLVLRGHRGNDRATILWLPDNTRPPWGDDLLLEFPEAKLVSKAFARLPDGHAPKAGDLTIHRDGTRMYLAKTEGSPLSPIYVDMKTGKTAKAASLKRPTLVVSNWAIIAPMVEVGEALIEFSEDPAVQ